MRLVEERDGVDERDTVVEGLRQDYWRTLGEDEDDGSPRPALLQVLVFCLGTRRFALATAECRHVVRVPVVVPLPGVARHVEGIINLRGRITSVTDLAALMGVGRFGASEQRRLIVAAAGEAVTALDVDRVEKILDLDMASIRPPGAVGAPSFVVGETVVDCEPVVVLSVPRLMACPAMAVDVRRNE